MIRKSLRKEEPISLAKLLEGSLSALLALPRGTRLEPKELNNDSKLKAILQNSLPEQRQTVELIQLVEMQLLAGAYTAAYNTCNQLYSLLEGFFKKRRATQHQALLKKVYENVCEALGDYLSRLNLMEDALLFYEEVAKLNPQDTAMLKKKGRLFYTSGASGLAEAEDLYRKAVKLDPKDLDNFENLGRVMEAWGDREMDAAFIYREALSHCRTDMEYIRFYLRIYALLPGDTDVVLRLGKLYRRLGMLSEARRYLEEAWERSANPWVALDLAWLYLLINEMRRGAELLAAAQINTAVAERKDSASSEHFNWKKSYLMGLLREEEGDFVAAEELYGAVAPRAKVYWQAQAGLVRLTLYGGHYAKAQAILQKIPQAQRSEMEQEYFELCRLMEETMAAEHPIHAAAWSEDTGKTDLDYQLKKDIYRRSMGPAFWRKYEANDVLGSGPAGQVYLGRERTRGQKMVVKMIQAEILKDAQVVRRLQGRLKLMGATKQRGLLFPEGDCYYNGDLYYVMEYMEGGNLAERLKHAPLPQRLLLKIARELLTALNYLYRYKKAFFHGAIKPENILFDQEGSAWISDFDLLETLAGSKMFSAPFIRNHSAFSRTFLYAAPERFNWKSSLLGLLTGRRFVNESPEMALEGVDHRADLYSLGVILYEMATGFLPCGGSDLKSLRSYHRSTHIPRALHLNPAVPEVLDEVITELLQKDPQRRFNSPAAVLKKIGQLESSVG